MSRAINPRTARPRGIQHGARMGWTFPMWGAVRAFLCWCVRFSEFTPFGTGGRAGRRGLATHCDWPAPVYLITAIEGVAAPKPS